LRSRGLVELGAQTERASAIAREVADFVSAVVGVLSGIQRDDLLGRKSLKNMAFLT
jgi:hypothetical protein